MSFVKVLVHDVGESEMVDEESEFVPIGGWKVFIFMPGWTLHRLGGEGVQCHQPSLSQGFRDGGGLGWLASVFPWSKLRATGCRADCLRGSEEWSKFWVIGRDVSDEVPRDNSLLLE